MAINTIMQYIRTLRSKPYAATFFDARSYGQKMSKLPRYKFMYYANFVLSAEAIDFLEGQLSDLGTWEKGISFKIRAIDKPSVDLSTTTLNQYNRKRNVYSKIDYHPFTIKIYDTIDDIPLLLWKKYFTYYFGDSRQKSDLEYNEIVPTGTLIAPEKWGLNPDKDSYNFFDKIELYAIFGKRYTQINYIKPKITKIDWQQYDSDSSDMSEMSMTLMYEALEYLDSDIITATDAKKFGFDIEKPVGDTYDSSLTADISAPKPDTQNMIRNMLNNSQTPGGTDLTSGISNNFNVANSTLNLFTNNSLGPLSQYGAGTVIGQSIQGTSQYLQVFNAATNPGLISQFSGTGFGLTPASQGVLGQFGNFDFGK